MDITFFLKYYGFTIIIATLIYSIGHLSLLLVKQDHSNTAKLLSLKLFTGTIVLVSLFAIFKTHGNTIYSGLLLMLLFILHYYKRTQKIALTYIQQNAMFFEFKEMLYFIVVIGIMVAFFSFLFGCSFDHSDGLYDFSYYAGLSNSLHCHGVEGTDFYVNMPGNTLGSVPVFYHYFELWVTAIIQSVFKITAFNALVYVVQPFFFSLIILLAKAYIIQNDIHKNKFVLLVVPFLIVILSSNARVLNIFLPQDHLRFITTQLVYYFNIKLSVIYICLFWVMLNKDNCWFEKCIPLGILCILFPTTLPAIVVGSLCFLIYLRIVEKQSFSWITLLYIITPAVYIAFFYSIQHNVVVGSHKVGISSILINNVLHYSFLDFKKIIGDTFYFYGAYLLYLLPLFLILTGNRKIVRTRSFNELVMFTIILFIVTTVAHSLTFGIWDADQFQKNLFFPFFNILSFIILLLLFKETGHVILLSFYIALNIFTLCLFLHKGLDSKMTDKTYKNRILNREFAEKAFTSVYIKNKSSYRSLSDKYIDFVIPYSSLRRYTDSYYPVCLSVFEIPQTNADIELELTGQSIQVSPFYRFAGDTAGKSIDSLKGEYIEKYKIDYLFLEKGNSFNEVVKSLPVEKRISFEDEPYEIIKFRWK